MSDRRPLIHVHVDRAEVHVIPPLGETVDDIKGMVTRVVARFWGLLQR